MRNAINWFEIPANNVQRAVAFYRTVLGWDVPTREFQGVLHGFLGTGENGVGGAIIAGPVVAGGDATTGHAGSVIYFNAGDQIEAMMARVEAAGGTVLAPPTSIAPQGRVALFIDSEGNRVGLHEQPPR